jgi:hypothetical protein
MLAPTRLLRKLMDVLSPLPLPLPLLLPLPLPPE